MYRICVPIYIIYYIKYYPIVYYSICLQSIRVSHTHKLIIYRGSYMEIKLTT